MESVKQYLSGFRIPDLQKLWKGDEVDHQRDKDQHLFVQFEASLVRLQELSLWTDPKRSLMALAFVHLLHWYLSSLSSYAPISFLANLAMLTFAYTTWTQRIWPEIRVPEAKDPDWTPVNPDVLSAPELVRLVNDLNTNFGKGLESLKQFRRNQPGQFCVVTSLIFVTLAFVGTYVSTSRLIYLLSVSYLTIPGLIRILVKHPAVASFLQKRNQKIEKEAQEDVVDAAVAEDKTLAQNVYAKLQSGYHAVSNLDLKASFASISNTEEDFLPHEDSASQAILESAIMNQTNKDPMQADSLDLDEAAESSLDSLLPIPDQADMPDNNDEGDNFDDDFLPSKSLETFKDEEEDVEEDENLATKDMNLVTSAPAMTRGKSPSPESEEDFEMISEQELAEVSP